MRSEVVDTSTTSDGSADGTGEAAGTGASKIDTGLPPEDGSKLRAV